LLKPDEPTLGKPPKERCIPQQKASPWYQRIILMEEALTNHPLSAQQLSQERLHREEKWD
jgi:hypothetical protein